MARLAGGGLAVTIASAMLIAWAVSGPTLEIDPGIVLPCPGLLKIKKIL